MKSRDHSSAEATPQSDYASAVIRVAVAQICGKVGYGAAEASALAVLTDVAGLYLRAIAKTAASSANFHGRTEANLLDVITSLEELNSVQGFEGASIPTSSALSSSLITELERFVDDTKGTPYETPFAKPLPRNTLFRKKVKLPKRGVDQYNEGRFRHVPKWLPSMPEIEKEEKREEKWGFGVAMKEETESECEKGKNNRVEIEGKAKNLPAKRMRVKFKLLKKKGRNEGIEQSPRSAAGVCRGGIGKRISCENHGDDGRKEKKKSSKTAKSMINPNNLRLSRPSDSIILS